jgi:benzoate-CoA ligase family protein
VNHARHRRQDRSAPTRRGLGGGDRVGAVPRRYNVSTDLLDRHVRSGHGDREAVRGDGRRWTYRELLDLTARVGNSLRAAGVRSGDRVALLLPDSVEFVAAYLGALRVGAVAVPCNPALRREDVAFLLRQSSPRAVLTHASLFEALPSASADDPKRSLWVTVGGTAPGAVGWEEWLGPAGRPCEPAETTGEDPAFWLWTSGSTGFPRAAVHRHQDWQHCCESYGRGVLKITSRDVTFSAARSFHAYGLGNGTVFPLYFGGRTVFLSGRPTPESMFAVLRDERPTLFYAVPTMYTALLAHAERGNAPDLSSVRSCVSAGEPLPGDIYRRWRDRFGVEILDGIGSTEVLHIYVSARPGKVRAGSTGTPVEGYSVRIVDEQGHDSPPGAVGDLLVRGRSITIGYSRESTVAPPRTRDGWLVSGDKFYTDADGYYWYVGRADDMFKSKAEWVSPIVVEGVVIEHPAVLESGVVGSKDSDGLTKPHVFVVLKPGQTASSGLETELREHLRNRLPGSSQPRWVEFVPELPKSPTGKVLRYQLRKRAIPAEPPNRA